MGYPGSKSGQGVWQRVINQIPPHHVLVVPFAGHCSVTRAIRPARHTVLIDRDRDALCWLAAHMPPRPMTTFCCDGIAWLRHAFALDAVSPSRPQGPLTGEDQQVWHYTAQWYFASLGGLSWDSMARVFVYCDPPYMRQARNGKRRFRFELGDYEHEALLTVLRCLPCDVLIHGYPSALYESRLGRWRHWEWRAQTRGGPKTEVCWANYPASEPLHDYRFVGRDKRQRERIRKRSRRLAAMLARVKDPHERGALLGVLEDERPWIDRSHHFRFGPEAR